MAYVNSWKLSWSLETSGRKWLRKPSFRLFLVSSLKRSIISVSSSATTASSLGCSALSSAIPKYKTPVPKYWYSDEGHNASHDPCCSTPLWFLVNHIIKTQVKTKMSSTEGNPSTTSNTCLPEVYTANRKRTNGFYVKWNKNQTTVAQHSLHAVESIWQSEGAEARTSREWVSILCKSNICFTDS